MNKMKKIMQYSLLVILFFDLSSCEKVIEIEVEDAAQQVVIEAQLEAGTHLFQVIITESLGLNDTGFPEGIDDAIVTLSDDAGLSYDIPYQDAGRYGMMITAQENTNYTLNVVVNEQTYTAQSFLKAQVPLTEISSDFQEAVGPLEEGFTVFFGYEDPADEPNYYSVVHYVNGEVQLSGESILTLTDTNLDGASALLPIRGKTFEADSEVKVELRHLDKSAYEYLFALSNITDGGMGASAAPANPKSNWSNNALGFFSAYSVDELTILVE